MNFVLRMGTAMVPLTCLLLANAVAGEQGKPTAGAILDAWRNRSADVAQGMVTWKVQPGTYGRFESTWVPSTPENEPATYTFEFDGKSAIYSSRSTEYPECGYSYDKSLNELQYFHQILFDAFPDLEDTQREALDYSIFLLPEQTAHVWKRGVAEYPRALLLPASPFDHLHELAKATALHADSATHGSGVPSPVVHQMALVPLLLAFRPELFHPQLNLDDANFTLELKEKTPELRSLVAVVGSEEPDSDALQWQLFLDERREFSVQRIIGSKGDLPVWQIDIEYALQDEQHWFPSAWTVQQLGEKPDMIAQAVSVSVSEIQLKASPDPGMNIHEPEIPEGAWVEDLANGRRYLALPDKPYEISPTENELYDYEGLLSRAQGDVQPLIRRTWEQELKHQANRFSRWPTILIPLLALGLPMTAAAYRYSRKNKARH